MQTVTTIAQTMLRFCGLTQIALGLLLWAGRARGMIAVHTLLGLVLAIALWTLAALAARAGSHLVPVMLALVWGLLVAALGLGQTRLLTGQGQCLVHLAHLIASLVAIGLGEALAARAGRGAVESFAEASRTQSQEMQR